jgi:repressor of nif and glnA expression
MTKSNYKKYSDLTLDELEKLVEELETMSIRALKEGKKSLRVNILKSVRKAIKEIEKRLKK